MENALMAAVLAMFIFLLSSLFIYAENAKLKNAAIEIGCAEYNSKTGNFTWKELEK